MTRSPVSSSVKTYFWTCMRALSWRRGEGVTFTSLSSMERSFWAPGRVNLIGDHTDYVGGLVLPIAVDLGIRLTIDRAERIVLASNGQRIDVAADGEGGAEGWGRYPAAVAAELAELGRPPIGMHGTVESDLPI